MLEKCLRYQVTSCPTAFAPRPARSDGELLAAAVSRVTKAPFYTRGVQRMGHSTLVRLGSDPARRSWISRPPPLLQENTFIGGDVLSALTWQRYQSRAGTLDLRHRGRMKDHTARLWVSPVRCAGISSDINHSRALWDHFLIELTQHCDKSELWQEDRQRWLVVEVQSPPAVIGDVSLLEFVNGPQSVCDLTWLKKQVTCSITDDVVVNYSGTCRFLLMWLWYVSYSGGGEMCEVWNLGLFGWTPYWYTGIKEIHKQRYRCSAAESCFFSFL